MNIYSKRAHTPIDIIYSMYTSHGALYFGDKRMNEQTNVREKKGK